MPAGLKEILPIFALLAIIGLVVTRLPRVELGHSQAFLRRRFINWFPLGLTYAFLYMGRYNLTVAKSALDRIHLMNNHQFGMVKAVGAITYGVAFLLNGPLTDRWGGRTTILIAALGSAVMNLVMGGVLYMQWTTNFTTTFSILYAMNMYFQSFGAVSIVKVNASWFHLRERGMFGGIFGILISLGIYFAFDWGALIVKNLPLYWVFVIPTLILCVFFVIDIFTVRDLPSQAGLQDFDTADATSHDDGKQLTVFEVGRRMLLHPVISVIALVEFCSGYLRAALMDWYYIFASQTGIKATQFVPSHWGLMQCLAGILGGMFAGLISDRVFQSRRGPVSAILYSIMTVGSIFAWFTLKTPALGWVVAIMMLAIIGVHGMLSGTASMDFGGRKNTGVAVGLIDGFVYLGQAAQAFVLGNLLPKEGLAARNQDNWKSWPVAMLIVAIIGFGLCLRLWNAKPQSRTAHH